MVLRLLWPPFGPALTIWQWLRAEAAGRHELKRGAALHTMALLVVALHGGLHAALLLVGALLDATPKGAEQWPWMAPVVRGLTMLNAASGVAEYGAILFAALAEPERPAD